MREVAVTGIGSVAPFGVGAQSLWDACCRGGEFLSTLSRFDTSMLRCRVAGQVDSEVLSEALDPKILRTTSRATQMALMASAAAIVDARLSLGTYGSHRFAVVVGTALGGWGEGEKQSAVLNERGFRRVNPIVSMGAGNHATGVEIARAHDARGVQLTLSTGCPSSLQAVAHAADLIRTGIADVCLAGGTESPLSPLIYAAFERTGELEKTDERPPSRPFDRSHSGIVLSEGACFLVLEARESAVARGARRYALISGATASCDAGGLFSPDASGMTAAQGMRDLLRERALGPRDLDYICSHANSSPMFDRREARILRCALGDAVDAIPVSSIKGVLGHPLGASGAFQVATAALAMERGLLPPTHNLKDPDPECSLLHVVGTAQRATIRNALVTSYGYGGVNACLLMTKGEQGSVN